MTELLLPPQNGVTVRMYRQGHGDCFLLAFPRKPEEVPFYVLIDCGLKPGSQNFIHTDPASGNFVPGPSIGDIVEHIGKSTNHHLDLVIITHEHQDHVNGIWKKNDPYFADFEIDEAWFAWTEDPTDELANTLRTRHRDQLLGLAQARQLLLLAAGETDPVVRRLDSLLDLEIGSQDDVFNQEAMMAAAKDPGQSTNKQAMKLIKDKASKNRGVKFLTPGDEPKILSNEAGIGVYVFGPPKSETLLVDEDPIGSEGFPVGRSGSSGLSFLAAAQATPGNGSSPFDPRFCLALDKEANPKSFFHTHYGQDKAGENDSDSVEVTTNAPWRRIDREWLYSAENLALKLNTGINNTSLVVAFELPVSKKILFFAGDAQRGNWISWDDQTWGTTQQTITARDILARTVLYKVGHHGSHNATLAGHLEDEYPNLSWMGRGKFASEFTAMITAVNTWAMKNTPPWRHPLPSIQKALEQKANGRVFRTDVAKPQKPAGVPEATWAAFLSRVSFNELYFDYTILDIEP